MKTVIADNLIIFGHGEKCKKDGRWLGGNRVRLRLKLRAREGGRGFIKAGDASKTTDAVGVSGKLGFELGEMFFILLHQYFYHYYL